MTKSRAEAIWQKATLLGSCRHLLSRHVMSWPPSWIW